MNSQLGTWNPVVDNPESRQREKKAKPMVSKTKAKAWKICFVYYSFQLSQNDQKQKSFCERKSRYFHMVDK